LRGAEIGIGGNTASAGARASRNSGKQQKNSGNFDVLLLTEPPVDEDFRQK
jgi:hypothetical protein